LISDELLENLLALNDIRKVQAHLKSPLDPNAVHMRLEIPAGASENDFTLEQAVELTLMRDAQAAVRVATEVVRGIGFNRPGFAASAVGS